MARAYELRTDKTWHQTHGKLGACFSKWGVTKYSIEPNTTANRLNLGGYTRHENAVTVRFTKRDREVVLSLDTQDTPASNLRALYLCIDAMRMLDVRGVGEVAATAYAQLAGPTGPAERDPYEVMGLRPDADLAIVEAVYRSLAKSRHPDNGGSEASMVELNKAIERIRTDRAVAVAS